MREKASALLGWIFVVLGFVFAALMLIPVLCNKGYGVAKITYERFVRAALGR